MQLLRRGWLAGALFLFTGCVGSSLTTVEYDPSTDAFQEIKYSNHFEGQNFLVEEKLKVLVYADVKGGLGVDAAVAEQDKWEKAEFKIYFSNKSEGQIIFGLNSILFQNNYYSDYFVKDPRTLQIVPNTVERIIIDDKKVDKFDKEFRMLIDYTYASKRMVKEVLLKRMTVDEYKSVKPKLFNF